MPQLFDSGVMTLQGESMHIRAAAGKCKIVYVSMAVGNGSYSSAEKTKSALKARTSLKSEKNRYAFSDIMVKNKNLVDLKALITNYDPVTQKALITSAYYVNEIGIYAKEEGQPDSAAVLVSMAVTASTSGNGDFMPPYNGQNPATITQTYSITVDDEANVTINVAGAALPAEDANKITDDVTKKRYKLGISNGNLYYVEVSE